MLDKNGLALYNKGMTKRIFRLCAGLAALALTAAPAAHSQGLPPPPPPLGPAPNAGPNNAVPNAAPTVVFPQDNPALNPTLPPPVPAAAPVLISVDAAAKRHDISPLIYCVSQAAPAQLAALNTTLNAQQVGPGLLNFSAAQFRSLGRVFSGDASPDTQALRNRSTRLLWDPRYVSPQSVAGNRALIPQLKSRLSAYPPGTKAGITSYDWGADSAIGGATAQADVLGIFGREGLGIATRTAPDAATPTFKAMQMYRNYDGHNSAFGSISVSDTAPDPDTLSSFAAVRRSDGALTVMVINKSSEGPTPVSLSVSHFAGATAQVWQLTRANTITHLPSAALRGGSVSATLPAQSITLFVVPAAARR